jgi:hypothetical protein
MYVSGLAQNLSFSASVNIRSGDSRDIIILRPYCSEALEH